MTARPDALLDRWLIDQDLTDDEAGEVQGLLEGPEGPGLRERLVLACLLGQALDDTSADAFASGVAERLRAVDSDAFARQVQKRLRPPGLWWRMAAACLAVVLAATLSWAVFAGPPDACRIIAGAEGMVAGHGDARMVVADGRALGPGDRLVAAGPAVVGWKDGTRIRLAAGTEVVLGEGRRLRLHAGTVDASVEPQVAGSDLAITTPDAVATVVGTRFTLSWDGRRTRLEVAEGTVRFAAAGRELDIQKGGLAETDPDEGLARWRSLGQASWVAETGAWTWAADGTMTGDGAAERARLVARDGAGDLDLACRIRVGGSVNRAELQCAGYAWFVIVLRRHEWSELRMRRRGRDVTCTIDGEPVGITMGDAAADPGGPPAFYVAVGGVLEIADVRVRTP